MNFRTLSMMFAMGLAYDLSGGWEFPKSTGKKTKNRIQQIMNADKIRNRKKELRKQAKISRLRNR